MTTLPSRQQVDQAAPLSFPERSAQPEKQANIQISITPAGLHITAEYTGSLASIPQTIERLRAAGLLDLVTASAPPAPAGQPAKPKAETVEPLYKPDGTACCPVHKRELSEGQYGLYCSARAKPGEAANPKGYCALRFAE